MKTTMRLSQRPGKRKGTLIVAVLVCLFVATSIVLGAVHISTQYRRQLRDDLYVEQARWLLDGSIRMALAKSRTQPDYQGETIVLDADSRVLDAGVVNIAVVPSSENTKSTNLHVTVELLRGATGQNRAQPAVNSERRWESVRTIRRSTKIPVSATD